MKNYVTTTLLSLTLLAVAPATASIILTDDFAANSLADYTTPTGRTAFSYSSSSGVGGVGGRLNPGTDVHAANFSTTIGSFTDSSIYTLSVFGLGRTGSGSASANVLGLGLGTSATTLLGSGYTGFEGVLRGSNGTGFRLRLRQNDSGTGEVISSGSITLVEDDWYEMQFAIELTPSNTFNVDVSLFNRGDNGLDVSGSALLTASISGVSLALQESSSLFAGFMGRNLTQGGVRAVDNFSVAIPEPSTYAMLLGLGVLGFVAARRMRRA